MNILVKKVNILVKVEQEWSERCIVLVQSGYASKWVFFREIYYERQDFATPKLIRIKIKRI